MNGKVAIISGGGPISAGPIAELFAPKGARLSPARLRKPSTWRRHFIPLRRFASPEEMAATTLFLDSDPSI
jgi:NAD(P)-dependent dehydrogenase (short-subunit alcohol dehydrogenase family)